MYLVKTEKPDVFKRFDKLAVTLYGINILPNYLLTEKIAQSQRNWEKYLFKHMNEPTKQPSWEQDLHIHLQHTETDDFVITETEISVLMSRAKEYDLDIHVVDKLPETCIYNEHTPVNIHLTEETYHTGIRYRITYGQAITLPCMSLDIIDCPLFTRIANAIDTCNNHICTYSYAHCCYENDNKIPNSEKEQLIKELKEQHNIYLSFSSNIKS